MRLIDSVLPAQGLMEEDEEEEHTASNPYCGRPSCWCHTNVSYHEQVQHPVPSDAEITQAYQFFELV